MADLEFSDSIDSKESLDDHHTSLAELVFAAEQRPSGEVLVRKVHPRTSSARALAAAAAPYCFLHGVERRRPDGSGRLMAPPKRSFVAAVPHAESEGGRAFVHVLCVPGGDAQRTSWDWACLAVVSARLRPELFEPYLHLLHARWAALSAAQQQLAELVPPAEWDRLMQDVPMPHRAEPAAGRLGALDFGRTVLYYPQWGVDVADVAPPMLPSPLPDAALLCVARAVDAPPAPKLMLRLLQCALCGRSIALFSRSATLLTVTAEALRALLAPFEWQCAYEPVVPSKRYLDALAVRAADEPFIVGVLANMPLEGVSSSFVGPHHIAAISPRVHCFDVDNAAIITEPRGGAPRLPDGLRVALLSALEAFAEAAAVAAATLPSATVSTHQVREGVGYAANLDFATEPRRTATALRAISGEGIGALPLDTKDAAVRASKQRLEDICRRRGVKDLYGPTPDATGAWHTVEPTTAGAEQRRRLRLQKQLDSQREAAAAYQEAEGALLTAAHAAISHHLAPPADRRDDDRRSRRSIIGNRSSGAPLERAQGVVLWRLGPRYAEFGRELVESPHFDAAVQRGTRRAAMTPVARAFGMGGEAARSQRIGALRSLMARTNSLSRSASSFVREASS